MPTYEYRCNACKREFEYEQRMSDDDLVTCEVCGEPKLEKLISRTAFQLKGSGWYKDLYSSAPAGGAKDAAAKTEPASSSADSSSSGTPSSTPAASTPSSPPAASAPAASSTPSSSSGSGGGGSKE